MMRALAGAAALLCIAAGAQASPTGTPQSNAPRSGTGTALDLPFGHHHDAAPTAVSRAEGGGGAAPAASRRHRSQAEWRQSYIARHGHDIVVPAHPGH